MISQLFTAGPFWSNPLLQSTVCIAVGLIVSLLLRRRSARAHQVLFLAMIAAVIVPAMSMIVRHYELGMFVDKPAVIQSQLGEIPILSIITEYEISPVPAIPNAYYPEPIEPEYAMSTAAVVREAKAKLPLSTILIWSWIIVSTILAVRLFMTFILGLGMLRRALPLHCDKLRQALLIAKGKLGIDKPVQVLAGNTVSSPVIWCWSRRPALLVPEDAEQFEDGVDWVGMFCHELAHWSRLDHISGLFAELMVCLFPWHPLMWWAKSRLAGLSEQACDDWVVAGSRSPADYAESLLGLSPQGQLSFLPAVVGRKNGLESRIRRIVKDKCGKPHLGLCWAVVVTLIAACITIGAAFAQRRPADTDQAKECEKLLSNEHKHKQHAEEKSLFEADLFARQIELLNQQQELQAEQQLLKQLSEQLKLKQLEQQQLEQLGSQLPLEQLKQKKNTEAAMQLRLARLKHLNALVQQQAEYRKQADIIESKIKILQQYQDQEMKLAAEGKPGLVLDKDENEVRQLQTEQLYQERQVFALEDAKLVCADVITISIGGEHSELIINRGENDGLAKGQFVLSDNSIVGSISDISTRTAQVKLFTDPGSKIAVKIGGANVYRLIHGSGNDSAKVKLLSTKYKVRVGDKVMARKKPGFLDAPMIIGVVAKCMRDVANPSLWDITVKPVCDIEQLKTVRVIIMNPSEASLPSNYVIRDQLHLDATSGLYGKTIHSDPIQQTTQRDQHTQYKRILKIESDNLQQEIDFLDGLRQDDIGKAETHEQICATLKAIDNNRHRIRSNVPPTLIGGELFKDDERAILKKLRHDLQLLADKNYRKLPELSDKEEAKKLRSDLKKIDAFIQHIDGRINSPAVWPQQHLQSRDEYEAKRKELLPKRRELEELRKHVQLLLKEAPNREDTARLRASLDEIDKRIRGIDFELSSPEWCAQKRKAEQTAMQKYISEMERAKANFNITTKRRDADSAMADFELKNRESEWYAEMRAFEADIFATAEKMSDTNQKLENDLATLKKMQQEIEFFTIENSANFGKDISLYNKWQTMKTNRDKLREQIEREKGVLAKYQKEFKAAVDRRNKYREYKPTAGTKDEGADYAITEFDDFVIQRKTKTPVMEDPWNTTPRQIPPAGRYFHRRKQIQTTTPPLQQGQAYSPWLQPGEKQQPGEKLQSRINQLQDEIRKLSSEMTEMRKLMKDLVEQKKKRPGKPLPKIHGYPLEPGEKVPETLGDNIHKGPRVPKLKDYPVIGIVFEQGHKEKPSIHGKKQPIKPLPEIHGHPLEPEYTEPEPRSKKRHEHLPDEIPNEPDEIETTEPIPLDD